MRFYTKLGCVFRGVRLEFFLLKHLDMRLEGGVFPLRLNNNPDFC